MNKDVPFTISEFRVLGNTVLPVRDVERAVYPFLGPDRRLRDVEAARAALANAYRAAGYGTVLIDIPEQDVTDGIVRLQVTEGRVGRLVIKGAHFTSARQIRDALTSVQPGTVPQLPVLQSQLGALARQIPEREITPTLKSGRDPGTLDVELKVKDAPAVHGSVELNDYYTPDTKHVRLNASLSYDNLMQRGDTFSAQYQTAPGAAAELSATSFTFLGHVGNTPDAFSLYFVHSNSNVAALGTLAVIGAGNIYGARYILAIPQRGNFSQNVTFGYDYKTFGQSVETTTVPSAETPIHYSLWSADYAGFLRQDRLSADLSFGIKFGLRGLGNTPGEFEYKRFEAKPNFMAFTGTEQVSRAIWHDASLTARLTYQYAPTPLVNNEQFALGGVETVRGYLEDETLWDSGAAASVELATPTVGVAKLPATKFWGLLFFDAGAGQIEEALPGQTARQTLLSPGVGLRLERPGYLAVHFDWAYPLHDGPRTPRGTDRWLISVRGGF